MLPQKKATIIASITAFFLAVFKLVIGIMSSSVAILSSAIDSLLDMFISLFNTFAIASAEEDPNRRFNYGKGKIEALASFLEGLIISCSGLCIFYQSIKKIINGGTLEHIEIGIFVMVFSIIVTGTLVIYLGKVYKKTKNIVVESDALQYKTDVFTNIGILLSLTVIYFTKLYIIDAIVGILISLYIIYQSSKIAKKGFLLLLDISLHPDEVKKIQEIINAYDGVKSFYDFRSRKSGERKFVEADIIFEKDMLLSRAHDISSEIEKEISKIDENFEWYIIFHLDSYDESEVEKGEK